VNGSFIHNLIHHLKGHTLAVTSIDWKKMGKGIGQLFVSCSDDQIIRFRDP
jgi:WD40 repeat protein